MFKISCVTVSMLHLEMLFEVFEKLFINCQRKQNLRSVDRLYTVQ